MPPRTQKALAVMVVRCSLAQDTSPVCLGWAVGSRVGAAGRSELRSTTLNCSQPLATAPP
jgi:hypothetical protein